MEVVPPVLVFPPPVAEPPLPLDPPLAVAACWFVVEQATVVMNPSANGRKNQSLAWRRAITS
jgi:hypothetical protein